MIYITKNKRTGFAYHNMECIILGLDMLEMITNQ